MKDYILIASILLICFLSIAMYGTYRCNHPDFKDPLSKSLITGLENYTDGWGILHLLFYSFLTYLYPKHWLLICITGVLWEGVEMIFKHKPFYLDKCNLNLSKNWWYGRYEDIIMNTIGVVIGYSLKNYKVTGYYIAAYFGTIFLFFVSV